MGIIEDIFGMDSGRTIHRDEFETAIKSLPQLNDNEKDYLRGVFSGALRDGSINKKELIQRIKMLEHNQADHLDAHEVEAIKYKLLGELEDNK